MRNPGTPPYSFHADLALVRRLEANEAERGVSLIAALRDLGYAPEADTERIGNGWALYAGPEHPLNRATGLGLDGPINEAELEALEQFYIARQALPTVVLCPLADPSLIDGLGQRKFCIQRFFNVLARPLSPKEERADDNLSAAIRVETAEEAGADRWVRTATGCADWRDQAQTDWLVALAAAAPQHPGVTCFLAYVEDEPAGVGALSILEGVGTLFHAFTRPEFRGRGVQSALIQARIAWAAIHGCELVTTTVSPPGNASQRNLERAGFQVIYTRPVLSSGR